MGSLSLAQNAILIGSLLGDGTLRRQGTRTNALFEVNHSVQYRDYVDWKWKYFSEYVLTAPKSRAGRGVRIAYRFTTRSLPIFTSYFQRFYKNGKKNLPLDLTLDPLALAVWFMDDGARSRSSSYLNTQQFTIEEQEFLQKLLWQTFSLKSSLNRDKSYWRLRISTESTKQMVSIIGPYILPLFQYKLGYDPVTTDSKDESLLF